MEVIKTAAEWKRVYRTVKDKKIGFVPTMGGLHEGHLSLIKKSLSENDITVVSVYLNPTQFNDKNDLATYPADFDEDKAFLEKNNVDYLFSPSYSEMYPDDYRYRISENDLSTELCGASRPGHFDGVLTIVMKLFNIIKPANAYFGEKDFQQYLLLKGMAAAFFMDVNIIPCPVVREESGLAVSSRNRKLSADGVKKAAELHRTLIENSSVEEKKNRLESAGFKIDYLTKKDGRLYAAVFLENVRLIDNVTCE